MDTENNMLTHARLISANADLAKAHDDRIAHLEESMAALAVLVNAIRDCVDTQTSIFDQSRQTR